MRKLIVALCTCYLEILKLVNLTMGVCADKTLSEKGCELFLVCNR